MVLWGGVGKLGNQVLRWVWNWPWRRKSIIISLFKSKQRWLLLLILTTFLYVIYSFNKSLLGGAGGHFRGTGPFYALHRPLPPPIPIYTCPSPSGNFKKWVDHSSLSTMQGPTVGLKIDSKVLLFVETTFSKLGREIAELLVHNRIKYKIEVGGKNLPLMTNGDKGRFGAIIFENYTKYLSMDKWNKELLDKYCREFNVGLMGFMPSREETYVGAALGPNSSILMDTNVRVKDGYLNPSSEVLRLTRPGDIVKGLLPNEPNDLWTVFYPNHTTYEPILMATRLFEDNEVEMDYFNRSPAKKKEDDESSSSSFGSMSSMPLAIVLQDKGTADGIRKVLFGAGLKFWLHRLLFVDGVSYLSRGKLSVPLKRYILIDVDDIFVGEKGTRLLKSDVEAMLESQENIQRLVTGFKFNLGFSGKYHHSGDEEENAGDDFILQNSLRFMWFGHMWNHIQPHLYSNVSALSLDMEKNKDFARERGIPVDSGYSVSPHHSGVYPVHEPLYDAWKKVWNIKVTSTEEYPHLRPARLRRGFIHRGVMVLPRQTCGLFTHTIFIDRYPGGRSKLDESIFGGELFQSIVYNAINVFMTHMSNYGNDRLGLYTFESVTKYIACWTNLQMVTLSPVLLAEKYFKMHPDEMDPVWGNPCDDNRHRKLWSNNKTCESIPEFLVIGPQKTGTTALYTFLSMHPRVASNSPSPDTFEEVQFFNGKNYYRGLDWYLRFFEPEENLTISHPLPQPQPPNGTTPTLPHRILFEKSATYFDNELVPRRAHTLLPRAKLITILISPSKRAYSWYQHMRAHNDSVALNYTFYEVLTAGPNSPKMLRDLRNRCVNPGRYAQHLERWLSYYTPQQLLILDGDELKKDPFAVMYRVQHFLQIEPLFNYSTKLRYDKTKGFFCQVVSQVKNKCLGRSKGRHYPLMDPRSEKYLQGYYKSQNNALQKLLKRLDERIPAWLKQDLSLRSLS